MMQPHSQPFGKECQSLAGLNAAVMDKTYDSDDIRRFLENQGVEAIIPLVAELINMPAIQERLSVSSI